MSKFPHNGPLVSILPKTLETFKDSIPDYLLWKDHNMSRTAMRQLSVAFEDNIATGMDWAAIKGLEASGDSRDALSYCLNEPVRVGEVSVYFLGITHSSDHSAEHVKEAISRLNPSMIALESCVDRTAARRSIQLPLLDMFEGDWASLTDVKEFGGLGPSLSELAKHGLLDGSMELAQFMVASGSVSGSPELTALFEGAKRTIPVESIDILESVKIVQNASIDALGYTSRRPGDLSEGVLRHVLDEETILSEYFRIMYGSENVPPVKPNLLYRLIESRKRSAPFADLLLRELHRMYRPKQYWGRIFLRDVYMSLRVKRLARKVESGSSILVIVGGAHVHGLRRLLASSSVDLAVHAAVSVSCLVENGENLCEIWRDILKIDSFSTNLPRRIENVETAAAMISLFILSAHKVSLWVGSEWQVVELPDVKAGERLHALCNFHVGGGVGNVDLVQALLDGKLDPYSISRLEAQQRE